MKNATTKNVSTTDDESSMNRFPYQLDLINIATYLADRSLSTEMLMPNHFIN